MRTLPQLLLAPALLVALGGALASAGQPIPLTGRSPHLGPMKGTLTITRQGDEAEVTFEASFGRGARWSLRGKGRISRDTLDCALFPSGGAAGALSGAKPKATHRLVVNRDGTRYWGECSGREGTTWFREALSVSAKLPLPDPTRGSAKERVRAGVDLLRRIDANGDGLISGRRFGNELDATKDPLARAIFDFVDYGNYGGQTSVLGPWTRGDVQEGGLGLGFTTRPKHYTSQRVISEDALSAGVQDLVYRLKNEGIGDLVETDLEKIVAAAQAEGLLPGDAPARYQAVHEATERLLDQAVKLISAKERATKLDGVPLTQVELQAGLKAGSLEALIAKVVIGEGGEQWMAYFKHGIRSTARNEQVEEHGQVGSILQHYLLVIGKRARETSLVRTIEARLPARAK